jgi:ubiquinone/menaquinone biosynthesis C-methylase UbiE
MGYKLFRKDVIDKIDYKNEYNRVSTTYNNWLSVMGQYTDKIIKSQYLSKNSKLKILDFACGTGYITRRILEKNLDCDITAVDYSDEMLEKLKDIKNNRVELINSDGLEFLKNTKISYDVIYFGWALSYFNHRELFELFKKVLKPGGTICIITNVKGTLAGIERIFLKVMLRNAEKVVKPMDIKFNLPEGSKGLVKWFSKYGFEPLEVDRGEVVMSFDEPEELLSWLNNTGASAGTGSIFTDYSSVKPSLIEEIRKSKCVNGKYEINHSFAYGIFKLK